MYINNAIIEINDIFSKTNNTKKCSTSDFIRVYNSKSELELNLIEIARKIVTEEKEQKNILRIEESLKTAIENKKSINWQYWTQEQVIQETTENYNTLCGNINCTSNCHLKCGLEQTADINRFKRCSGVNGDKCTTCGHDAIKHFHGFKKWKVIPPELVIDEKGKEKYDYNEKLEIEYNRNINVLKIKREKSLKLIIELKEKSKKLVDEYQSICLIGSFKKHLNNMCEIINQYIQSTDDENTKKDLIELRDLIKLKIKIFEDQIEK